MANDFSWFKMHTWSFNEALGDTINEKYESLYVELMTVAAKVGDSFHVVCGPELGSIFETATCGFQPEPWPDGVDLVGFDFFRRGRINKRFDVYIDKSLKDIVYVCGNEGVERIKIKDFDL